jgi:CBS domain-containing protein
MIDNYNGDVSFFEKSLTLFGINSSHLFAENSNILTANSSESLYEVLKKMRDKRIASIPI